MARSRVSVVFRSRTGRLSLVLGLTLLFFVVEIVVGNLTASTSLVADAFHMLSDVLALLVAIIAIRVRTGKERRR